MTDAEYTELVRLLADERERQAQTKGAMAEMERRLLEEFGLRTVAEARAELKRVEKELAAKRATLDREVEAALDKVKDRPEFSEFVRRACRDRPR